MPAVISASIQTAIIRVCSGQYTPNYDAAGFRPSLNTKEKEMLKESGSLSSA